MSDRVVMRSPLGRGTAVVSAGRVDRYQANGWTVVPPRPVRRRKSKADEDDDE